MNRSQMVDVQVQAFEHKAMSRAHWGQDTEAKERRALRLAQGVARSHRVVWDDEEDVYVGRWS
jgi:hypothetical protein